MLSKDFKLSRLHFELRFPPAYSLWDNAGAVAQKIEQLRPGIQNVSAQPNEIEFRTNNLSLKCGLGNLNVGGKNLATTADVEEYGKLATDYVAAVNDVLHVTQYLRVGARFVFTRTFAETGQASKFVLGTGMLAIPAQVKEHLAEDEHLRDPNVAFRIESAEVGVLYRIQSVSQSVELMPDFDLADEVPGFAQVFHRVVVDADRYTRTPVPVGKLQPSEWIMSSFRVITRDGQRILGDNS